MVIDWRDLSEDALNGVIEDFVTREGTDYGQMSTSLEQKVASVLKQLQTGRAVVVFDDESSSCSILPAEDGAPI